MTKLIKMGERGPVTIHTPQGPGLLDDVWISPLGFFMVRVYYSDPGRWTSYNLGKMEPGEDPLSRAINLKEIEVSKD